MLILLLLGHLFRLGRNNDHSTLIEQFVHHVLEVQSNNRNAPNILIYLVKRYHLASVLLLVSYTDGDSDSCKFL